jgi:hypothetical protein
MATTFYKENVKLPMYYFLFLLFLLLLLVVLGFEFRASHLLAREALYCLGHAPSSSLFGNAFFHGSFGKSFQ